MQAFFKKYAIVLIVLMGIVLRAFIYIKNISFWGDEASLALNILEKQYLDLFKGLDYLQVAPPLFLVLTKIITSNLSIDTFRDLMFRLVPFICGIATLPVFYKFSRLVCKTETAVKISTFIFTFNMTAILYSAQFKQYSVELLISTILLIIFYKLINQNSLKLYYPIIIALAPWFSLSSLFIIGSYFWIMIFRNRKAILQTFIPFFVSFGLFYFVSLHHISSVNYSGMYTWWQNGYGFVDFTHPMRLVIRFGELFTFDKTSAIIFGGTMMIIGIVSVITNKNNRLFLTAPILLTLFASALKLYPIEARLTLFLLPLIAIIIGQYEWKFKKSVFAIACTISFVTSIYYTVHPYKFYTSAREVVAAVEDRIVENETIILDSAFHRYYYYINPTHKIIILPESCCPFTEACNSALNSLPEGKYYLILKENPADKISANINVIAQYDRYSSVLYFEK